MLNHLTGTKTHAQIATNLNHLTVIIRHYQSFILDCRVNLSKNTADTYNYLVGRFIQYCMDNEIIDTGEVRSDNVRMFFLRMQESNNPTSMRTYHRHLKRFFNWLVAEGFIEKSPMLNIRQPRKEQKDLTPFTLKDIQSLMYVCSGPAIIDARNRAIILIFLDTGVRKSEMTAMKWKNINVDAETIKIHGKGAKERVLHMGKKSQRALYKYLNMLTARGIQSDYVWLTEEFKQLTADGLASMIKVICKRSGIVGKKRGPHTFRHTFAMNFLRSGGDAFSLQVILGHSKLDTVKIYLSMWKSESAIEVHRNINPVDNMKL